MDGETQGDIKKTCENVGSCDHMIVVLGTSDIEGAKIAVKTVTAGDPTFTGPLAGVPLGLKVYHILEPEIAEAVPRAIYEENVGIWKLVVNQEEIGMVFRSIREEISQHETSD